MDLPWLCGKNNFLKIPVLCPGQSRTCGSSVWPRQRARCSTLASILLDVVRRLTLLEGMWTRGTGPAVFIPHWGKKYSSFWAGIGPKNTPKTLHVWSAAARGSPLFRFFVCFDLLLAEVEFCRGQRNHYRCKAKFTDILIVILHCFTIKQLKIG